MELKVLRRVSSAAQSAATRLAVAAVESATMHTEEVLLTQKTSRQQAVTPRFGGRLVNTEDAGEAREETNDELG